MELPRRQFLRLTAGAIALPVALVLRGRKPTRRDQLVVPVAAGGGLTPQHAFPPRSCRKN